SVVLPCLTSNQDGSRKTRNWERTTRKRSSIVRESGDALRCIEKNIENSRGAAPVSDEFSRPIAFLYPAAPCTIKVCVCRAARAEQASVVLMPGVTMTCGGRVAPVCSQCTAAPHSTGESPASTQPSRRKQEWQSLPHR